MVRGWFQFAIRCCAIVALSVLVGVGFVGCDEGERAEPPPARHQPEEDEAYDVSGLWRMKGSTATYSLRQQGVSIQGRYSDPTDPTVHGDIAGVVDGQKVVLYVAVTFDTRPQENFVAKKEGLIRNPDHMTLVVTEGPRYVGRVQEWYRL